MVFRYVSKLSGCSSMDAVRAARYGVISCFSVVKWIHYNNGDAGVQRLFDKVAALLRPGGIFIFEFQVPAARGGPLRVRFHW